MREPKSSSIAPLDIKTAVQAPSTCSRETVQALEKFLDSSGNDHSSIATASGQLRQKKNTTERCKPKAANNVNVYDDHGVALSKHKRLELATGVVNDALQALGTVIKSQPITASNKAAGKSVAPSGQRQEISTLRDGASSPSSRPVREISSNCTSPSPETRKMDPRHASEQSRSDVLSRDGTEAIVQCARISFEYLRAANPAKSLGLNPDEWQVEQGMIAFISKLIGLRFAKAAAEELRSLKRRLELRMMLSTEATDPKKPAKGSNITHKKETLATLLQFEALDIPDSIVRMVITYQMLVMRTIGITTPQAIELTKEYLAPDCPTSPLKLAQKFGRSAGAIEPAAHIMDQLAQVLLSFCPPVSNGVDVDSDRPPRQIKPETCIWLQSLALLVRGHWMSLSKHRGDVSLDILKQFKKCVTLFLRRSSNSTEETYRILKDSFELLSTGLAGLYGDSAGIMSLTGETRSIYHQLSHLAEQSYLYEESRSWLQILLHASKQGAETSTAENYTVACRLASLNLSFSSKQGLEIDLNNLKRVLSCPPDRFSGTSDDLSRMIYAVFDLRRAASNFIKINTESPANDERSTKAIKTCYDILTACIISELEFIGLNCGQSCQLDSSIVQDRKASISKGIKASIEAVAYHCFRTDNFDKDKWRSTDKRLRLCMKLVQAIESDTYVFHPSENKVKFPSQRVLLSNAFFHLYSKSQSLISDQGAASLVAACELLAEASPLEKRDGNLHIKIERLAKGHLEAGRRNEARDKYLAFLQIWGDMRLFNTTSTSEPVKPLPFNWKNAPELELVVDVLRILLDFEASRPLILPSERPFFCPDDLQPDDNAAVLFWQLSIVSESITSKAMSTLAAKLVSPLTATLYDLCPERTHRTQRALISLQVFKLASSLPDSVPKALLETAEEYAAYVNEQQIGESNGSKPLSPWLRLCLAAAITMQPSLKRGGFLEDLLSSCSQIVQSCTSWNEFIKEIDDINMVLYSLSALFHFLGSKGRPYLQISVARLAFKLYKLRLRVSPEGFVKVSIDLGLELLRLGYSELAGVYFSKAREQIDLDHTSNVENLDHHLAYAEYFLDLGDWHQCRVHLAQADSLSEKSSTSRPKDGSNQISKICDLTRKTDLLHFHSCLNFRTESFLQAFWFAKREVTILQAAWRSLEGRLKRSQKTDSQIEPIEEDLVNALTQLKVSGDSSTNQRTQTSVASGSAFWPLVPRLCRALIHLSELYQCSGLSGDATYNLDQAERLADGIDAGHTLGNVLIRKGDCDSRAGNVDSSWTYLDRASKIYGDDIQVKDAAILKSSVGYFYRLQQQWKAEQDAYEEAESIVAKLIEPNFIQHLKGAEDIDIHHETGVTDGNAVVSSEKRCKKLPGISCDKPNKPTNAKLAAQRPSETNNSSQEQFLHFGRLQNDLVRLKAESMLSQGHLDESARLISRIESNIPQTSTAEQKIFKSRQLVCEATTALAKDRLFSMITESAVSFPNTVQYLIKTDPEASETMDSDQQGRALQKRSRSRVRQTTQSKSLDNVRLLLNQVLQNVSNRWIVPDNMYHISALRQVSATVRAAFLLLSSVNPISLDSPLSPGLVGRFTDLPQSIASVRDQAAARAENLQKNLHPDLSLKVECDHAAGFAYTSACKIDNDFIENLPVTWNVISVSLDDSQTHLHLTRHRAGRGPFIMRLPLTRQNTESIDAECFTFDEAKLEFLKIIELSDVTVHAAKDDAASMKDKSAKSRWWAEREALDSQLQDFLTNIENMWLGGFRGIFSQHQISSHLLSRFEKSFEFILESHLPSRQKSRTKTVGTRIKLDPQVLDLFIGLVKSKDDIDDLDDALLDLLYFVVDILQFKGETNAYDEIDFDAMIIETQDALRSYQEALGSEPLPTSPPHTVLILDKELHKFPWESLPCLDGTSVSRVYSTIELNERLRLFQNQRHANNVTKGLFASIKRGTSILNPSGDLGKTQSRFEQSLSSLSQPSREWTTITGRVPTEDEFTDALYTKGEPSQKGTPNGILLYFGHGSGAQYIRHRKIKQLRFQHTTDSPHEGSHETFERCYNPNPCISTALLFGCSSASLREHLEFEPHGTPKSYMLAGAPSLLGSLWDVTDGDVDKFAAGVLERWGLFSTGTFDNLRKEGHKVKSKHGRAGSGTECIDAKRSLPVGEPLDSPQGQSLTEAVARSRGDCYLKYLNGAAMVVYGVPTYLDTR